MIRLDIAQGSDEWIAARLGRPTASRFGDIMSPKERKPSRSQEKYMAELLAEWALGMPLEPEKTFGPVERGSEQEAQAVAFYELEEECDVQRVGLVLRDDKLVACSPDGLIYRSDGTLRRGLELKVPMAKTHVLNLLTQMLHGDGELPMEYMPQIQGGIWLTGAPEWDWRSHHPTLPRVTVRVARDVDYIADLAGCVDKFCARLESAKEALLARGVKPMLYLNPYLPSELIPPGLVPAAPESGRPKTSTASAGLLD